MPEEKGVHDGHRQRLLAELINAPSDAEHHPHKVLEALLFFSIQRRDTNEIAHELLNHFGTLDRVLNAPAEELVKFKYITPNTVALFRLINIAGNTALTESRQKSGLFNTSEDAATYFMQRFSEHRNECFAMLSLNNRGRLLGYDVVSLGTIDEVQLNLRKIAEIAVTKNATSVIVAHNHPGGTALPSAADAEVTKTVAQLLATLKVNFLDHLIIADGDYYSFSESPAYAYLFKQISSN